MKSKIHYTVIGAGVIFLSMLLIGGFFWLSVHKRGIDYNTYLVYMHQEVSGLSVQSQVRFNGVDVGYVESISLDADNPQLVVLKLAIDQSAPISSSTIATLRSQGVTGVDYLSLEAETMNAPPLLVRPGEQYPVILSKPSWVMQVSEVLPAIAKKISSLSDNINKVFSDKNEMNISTSLKNIQKFTQSLNQTIISLGSTMRDLHTTINNINSVSIKLPTVVDQLQKTLHAVSSTANKVGSMSTSIKGAFSSSQHLVDNLSTQVIPQTQQVLQRLSDSAVNLQGLSEKLQQNPSALIRGSQSALPGPGEK
jgi:phospholipid/cholesterol/gamma-HCH transport system substrate-binding protein